MGIDDVRVVWSQGLRRFADTYKSLTIALQKQMLRFYGFVGAYLGGTLFFPVTNAHDSHYS